MAADLAGTADAELPRACVVYGGGTFGRRLVRELTGLGIEVVGLVDRLAPDPVGDPPASHPEAMPELGKHPVLLGVCNPYARLNDIAAYLGGLGCTDIWSPARIYAALGRAGRVLEHYWLTTDVAVYERSAAEIAQARAQLADERSTAAFDGLLAYRTTGAIDALPEIDQAPQYLPRDVDFVDGSVVLLDLGAYDGDTVRSYLEAGVELESVVAFEPDPANFDRLARELAGHEKLVGMALPLAVGAKTELVRFAADGTTGAAIAESGDLLIQSVTLDDTLHGWRPTHVKIDIEGAEPDALSGMSRLLTSVRPRLAVCVYHRPEHLWTVLLQLAALDLGYRFHLRCHGEQCFDSVLYATPS